MKILVIDIGWHQTAYLVTELFRAGIDVTLATSGPPSPWLNRYCRQIPTGDVPPADFTPFLLDLVRRESPDVVFPAAEPVQQVLWQHAGEFASPVFPSTTSSQVDLLTDRCHLYDMVAALGVPVPRYLHLTSMDDLTSAVGDLGLPCVIRGTQGMSGEQVQIATSTQEVRAAYENLTRLSPAPPFAQEFVAGTRCLIGGLFEHGRALQWFSQQTLESVPAPTGPSVRIRSHVDPTLTEYARLIFEALEWDGLACAEFLQQKDGSYRFLEINPRPWAAIQAASTCGVPLLRLFAEYLQGKQPTRAITFKHGTECTLFPAFLAARIRSGEWPRWQDRRAYWQTIKALPLTRPHLLLHFIRMLSWAHDAAARRMPPHPHAAGSGDKPA